jgi:O-acetyl-ADP-ribose deacetylase (regulator of RNase III)
MGLASIAVPALGTGVGGFPVDEAARVMIDATCNVLHSTHRRRLSRLYLCSSHQMPARPSSRRSPGCHSER